MFPARSAASEKCLDINSYDFRFSMIYVNEKWYPIDIVNTNIFGLNYTPIW